MNGHGAPSTAQHCTVQPEPLPCPDPSLTAASGTTALSVFQELWESRRGRWTPPGLGPSQADPSSLLFGKGPKVLSIPAIHLNNGEDGLAALHVSSEGIQGGLLGSQLPFSQPPYYTRPLEPTGPTLAWGVGTMHIADCGDCLGQSDGDSQGTGTQLWGWQNNQSSSHRPEGGRASEEKWEGMSQRKRDGKT